MGFFKRLMCDHSYKKLRTIHGDEINHRNGARSEWECRECSKRVFSKYLTYLEKL